VATVSACCLIPLLITIAFSDWATENFSLAHPWLANLQSGSQQAQDKTSLQTKLGAKGITLVFEGFVELSKEQEVDLLIQEALSIEFAHCSFMRHQRKCNECRYPQGELSTRSRSMGSPKTPVVRSRVLRCEFIADRYLPGLTRCLDIKNQFLDQPSFAVSLNDIDGGNSYWTTYMIRCPGCSTWKE
jgi:hypothetical protein